MASETFPFNRLLPEIRLMVWEQTWPEGRVVEVGLYDNQDWEVQSGDEPTEYMALRLSGTISTFLNHDFGSRIIEDPAIEKCLDPIALQICRESRAVTLRHYVRMTHSKLGRSFYLNPSRDILWLCTDMTDGYGDLELLKGYYSECWGRIKRLLVPWEEYSYGSYPKNILAQVTGLQVVQVLLGEYGDGDVQMKTENEGETENQEEGGGQGEIEKEGEMEEDDSDMDFAREMIERDGAIGRKFPWTVQYIDQKGNVFCQWSKAHGVIEGVCV